MIITSTGFDPHEGWIGNKFFKYATMISLAKEFNAKLCLDKWMCDAIFELNREKQTPEKIDYKLSEGRNPLTVNTYHEDFSYIINVIRQNNLQGKTLDIAYNCNTFYHTSYYNNFKEDILRQFKFKNKISNYFDKEIEKIKKNLNIKKILICNMRLSDDYANKWKFPVKEFLETLKKEYTKDNFTIFVTTDSKKRANEILKGYDFYYFDQFAKYDILEDLKEEKIDLSLPEYGGDFSFLSDYYLMTKADKIICSDSTFSYSASMLNKNVNCEFFKYSLYDKKFISFNPWDTWLLDFRTFQFLDKSRGK